MLRKITDNSFWKVGSSAKIRTLTLEHKSVLDMNAYEMHVNKTSATSDNVFAFYWLPGRGGTRLFIPIFTRQVTVK
jgi:hypothetical protein